MKRWSGFNLRYVTMHFDPYNIFYNDPTTGELRVHGLAGSLLGNVTASMNMTYSIVQPPDNQYGMVLEKTQELVGMPQLVIAGEGDITGPFPDHPLFLKDFHLVAHIHQIYTSLAIVSGMKHQYVNTPTSFTDAFDSMTWYLLMAAYCSSLIVLVAYNGLIFRSKSMTVFDSVFKWLFSMFAALLQEATSEKPSKRWFERVFQGLWLVMCTLMSYTFLGTMKANLIVLTPTLRIDSTQDVLEHPELTVYFGKKTPSEQILMDSPGEIADRLREHARINSVGVDPFPNLMGNPIRDSLAQRRGIVYMEEKFMRIAVSKWCVDSPYYFYFAEQPFMRIVLSLVASKKLPAELLEDIDLKVMWLQAFDVRFMSEKELLAGHSGCIADRDKKTSENMKSIQVNDLNEINMILLIGQAAAILVFLLELMIFRCRKRSLSKRSRRK